MTTDGKAQSPSGVGVTLTREALLSADWKAFSLGVVESAINFLLKGPADGGASGLVSLSKLIGSIAVQSTAPERAWALTLFSFAFALNDIKLDDQVEVDGLRKTMLNAIDKAKASVDSGTQVMPQSFLDRPTTLPLYQDLRQWVVDARASFVVGPNSDATRLGFRLDVAFNRAVFATWSKNPEIYKVITEALNSPGGSAVQFDLSWNSYRQSLIQWFEVSPVFGQERSGISMSQLYTPLRGFWIDKDKTPEHYYSKGDIPPHAQLVMIDDELDKWIDSETDTGWLRLIGGGPGSGKSTTLRALARRLADRADLRPLYVPLQHIGLAENLRESINRYFTDQTNGHFMQPPLSRTAFEHGPPIVLILDGLDELAAPNEGASEVINTFSSRLGALVSALRGDGAKKIKVVVSGRMPAFQAAKRHLAPTKEGCLEAYGFLPIEGVEGDKSLWGLDQRIIWWKNYAAATNQSPELPPAFATESLSGITHEPLLCYLLVLSGFATSEWQQAADNPNRIYAALMRDIYDRGWGEGEQKRLGAGSTLTLEDFNVLMETIGLAAWLGGDTRIATEASFLQAVKITGAQSAWGRFKADNGSDVTNLAMNFYFKSAEGSQRGFEFTHKSFGEYLVALALISVATSVVALVDRKVDHALREFADATRTGVMTSEILRFARDEMALRVNGGRLADHTSVLILKTAFVRIAQAVIEEGFPSDHSCSWRTTETQQ